MLRKWMFPLLSLVIFLTVGCKGFDGPFANRQKSRPDLPQYSIEEQRKRARDRYAMPDDDFRMGPTGDINGVSPVK